MTDRVSGEYSGQVTTRRRVRRSMAARRPFVPWGLLPLLGLFGLLFFSLIWFSRHQVEDIAEMSAERALASVGAEWASATASGQRVLLEGAAPSREAANRAIAAVREVRAGTPFGVARPVTRVIDRQTISPTAPPAPASEAGTLPQAERLARAEAESASRDIPDWTYSLSQGVITLEGEVGSGDARRRIVNAADREVDPPRIVAVQDRLVISDVADTPELTDLSLQAVRAISECISGATSLRDGRFSLICDAPEGRAQTVEQIAGAPLPAGEFGTIEVTEVSAAMACEGDLAALLARSKIEFATGSARIQAGSGPLLDLLTARILECPGKLRIEGHTDNTGRVSTNARLSYERAQAVRAELIARGVPADRLTARGYGARDPIADNATADGRARNRRIEIRVESDPDPTP